MNSISYKHISGLSKKSDRMRSFSKLRWIKANMLIYILISVITIAVMQAIQIGQLSTDVKMTQQEVSTIKAERITLFETSNLSVKN